MDERLDGTENTEKENTLKMFRKTCDQLTNRVDKMNRVLSDDVSICQHKEAKEAKDGIKIVTYVVGPNSVQILQRFSLKKSPAIPYIAITSFIAGLWVAFPKEARVVVYSKEKRD